MMDDVERSIREFYDNYGWVEKDGIKGEDRHFRDFFPSYYAYHAKVQARTIGSFDKSSGKLLIAGGGDLPQSHLTIASQYEGTTFIDISREALQIAKKKSGSESEYIHGSILEIPKQDNCYDAAFCAHVIYHIDRENQKQAVSELIRVVKPGGRIVIIYKNPNSLPKRILRIKRAAANRLGLKHLAKKFKKKRQIDSEDHGDRPCRPPLYNVAYPIDWWSQFEELCAINVLPWEIMGSFEEKQILKSDSIARKIYRFVAWFENKFPRRAAQLWTYPMFVMTKKPLP